jgi:hypothetical protein
MSSRLVRVVVAGLSLAMVTLVTAPPSQAATRVPVSQLRLMNYYPADAAWSQMWTRYSHARTAADFQAIASLHANAVRIIVQPTTVGYPVVRPDMLARFRDMLATARAAGLSVQLTLFDWWASYSDVVGSQRWLASLLAGQKNNPTIALVELKNELPPTSVSAVRWAQQLLPYLPTLLPGVPRTVSASGTSGVTGLASLVGALPVTMLDVIDVHYYGSAQQAPAVLAAARALGGGIRTVIVGEAGRSTLGAASEQAQATFFTQIAAATRALKLPPPAPWILSDFTAGAIPTTASAAEYHYGLRRTDGSWKPAAAVVRTIFAGS